ncbi:MAG: hypothetical protein KKA42_11645, partial [candidate division Zixibacteria bacterium]|nr:hypothetical protein [candidate division Zixibacteria bacterium]
MEFFKAARDHSVAYLRVLLKRGWRLTEETIDTPESLRALSASLLGILLASPRGKPFPLVFAFFEKRGVVDFHQANPDILYRLFRELICGCISQELWRRRREEAPEASRVKRRFTETLR